MIDFQLSRKLILASGSPRRKELMQTLGLPFSVLVSDVDENFPENFPPEKVPALLSERKANTILRLEPEAIVLAADTVVVAGHSILNKPEDEASAMQMLEELSGRVHSVYTAFTLASAFHSITITDKADVYFKSLTQKEINYYLQKGNPYDKAGAYGIQEWIGLVAVERIEGSYFTVMGLPCHLVWQQLIEHYL